jgi:hypothetical protein
MNISQRQVSVRAVVAGIEQVWRAVGRGAGRYEQTQGSPERQADDVAIAALA